MIKGLLFISLSHEKNTTNTHLVQATNYSIDFNSYNFYCLLLGYIKIISYICTVIKAQ